MFPKEYIRQCEKAVEVQKLWKPTSNDYYYCNNTCILKSHLPVSCKDKYKCYYSLIWLPRQDQLQEMLLPGYEKKFKTSYIVVKRSECLPGYYYQNMLVDFAQFVIILQEHGLSMEQLWLAFVMKEKYNKTWAGTDWQPAGKERRECLNRFFEGVNASNVNVLGKNGQKR